MPIFLFNYSDKLMHGIFQAECQGQLDISPHGWTGGSATKRTDFPAQARRDRPPPPALRPAPSERAPG